jgi:hypothetical protein
LQWIDDETQRLTFLVSDAALLCVTRNDESFGMGGAIAH